tara:strand:- start:30 stop:422 length:393 start_codon:yes stop_codon:yes gene_type:complete
MSTILVNTLTGTSTAGSIAVTGEGNSTTTNLQQGLAKMWCRVNYSSGTPVASDSLNVSSLDDDGTGDIDYNFTNNPTSLNCSTVATSASSSTSTLFTAVESTSNARTLQYNSSGSAVDHNNSISMHGDLA